MSAKSFIGRHVLHNLGLKLTSLLLATGLWVAVASSPSSEVALSVPIILRSMPGELEVSSERIPEAQIRIRGPERIVQRLQAADVHVEIDLSGMNYSSVHFSYDSSAGILSVNDGTKITDIQFLGSYLEDSFKFAVDESGGTIVYAQPPSGQAPLQNGNDTAAIRVASSDVHTGGQDTFVFARSRSTSKSISCCCSSIGRSLFW